MISDATIRHSVMPLTPAMVPPKSPSPAAAHLPSLTQKVIGVLLLLALITQFVSTWSSRAFYQFSNVGLVDSQDPAKLIGDASNISFVRYINMLFLLLLVLCVVVTLFSAERRVFRTKYWLCYLLIAAGCLGMLFLKSPDPWAYLTSISSASTPMGPVVILAMSLFFLTYDPRAWAIVRKILVIFAMFVVAFLLGCLPFITFQSRLLTLKFIYIQAFVLETLVLIVATTPWRLPVWLRWLRFLPIVVQIYAAVLLETRLLVLMPCIQLLFFLMIIVRHAKRNSSYKRKMYLNIAIGCVAVFVLAWLVVPLFTQAHSSILGQYASDFQNRMFEDTRSQQMHEFMAKFWTAFPLGAGYPALGKSLVVDSGYLLSIYTVGLPVMLIFLLLFLRPIFKALFRIIAPADAAVVAVAATYAIRLATTAATAMTCDFLIFILLAGRCAYLVSGIASNYTPRQRTIPAQSDIGTIHVLRMNDNL